MGRERLLFFLLAIFLALKREQLERHPLERHPLERCHERDGRRGQRRLRAKNSAEWIALRLGDCRPVFEHSVFEHSGRQFGTRTIVVTGGNKAQTVDFSTAHALPMIYRGCVPCSSGTMSQPWSVAMKW